MVEPIILDEKQVIHHQEHHDHLVNHYNQSEYHRQEKRSKKWMGFGTLKALIGLKVALITTVSAIFIFIPLGFNESSLILIPVFCIIIACNSSSWTSILNGAILVWSTFISALYIYLVDLVVPRDIFWVSFIILFFWIFIICSLANGRKWVTQLSVKKICLDVSIILYFTKPTHNMGLQVWENIVMAFFIFISIYVVGIVCFPTLASRLFMLKLEKTLISTKDFFRGVGYQMEARISQDSDSVFDPEQENIIQKQQQQKVQPNTAEGGLVAMPKNNSFNFPMFPEHTRDSKEMEATPVAHELDSSSNVIQLIPPLPMHHELKRSGDVEKPLPITYRRETVLNASPTNTTKPRAATTNNKKILSTSVKIPTEGELQEMNTKLTFEINRLTQLLNETKQETWNVNLVPSYEKLLTVMEMNQKQLISIKLAVHQGFSRLAGQEIILPMLPFLNSIIEEVYLQIGLIIEVVNNGYSSGDDIVDNNNIEMSPKNGAETKHDSIDNKLSSWFNSKHKKLMRSINSKETRDILQESFVETQSLIKESQNIYKQLVGQYQKSNLPTLQATEITKVHFFIFGICSFAFKQQELTEIIYKINQTRNRYPIQFELLAHGSWYLIQALPRYVINRSKLIFKTITGTKSGQTESSRKPIWKPIWNYFFVRFFANEKWHFPLQLAIAFTAVCASFYYFEARVYNQLVIHGVWACATVGLVMSPSVGATVLRGMQRIVGTIVGGLLGFLVSLLVNEVPTPAKEIILMVVTFLWVFVMCFIQQDPRFSYAAAVSSLTYLIIAFGQYFATQFNYFTAVLRSFHIVLGCVWVIVVCIIVFPYFTYKKTKFRLMETTVLMNDTFIRIVESGLRLDGSPSSSIDYETINRNVGNAIRDSRINMSRQKTLLYDIKSELTLKPWGTNPDHFFKLIDHMGKTFTRLVATESSFHTVFSDNIINAMHPINQSVSELLTVIKSSNEDLKSLIINYDRPYDVDFISSLDEHLTKLNSSFQAVRHDLLQKKILFNLHPEMINFGSGIYSIRDYVKHYIQVLEEFKHIKKDHRSHSRSSSGMATSTSPIPVVVIDTPQKSNILTTRSQPIEQNPITIIVPPVKQQ